MTYKGTYMCRNNHRSKLWKMKYSLYTPCQRELLNLNCSCYIAVTLQPHSAKDSSTVFYFSHSLHNKYNFFLDIQEDKA